MGGGAGAGLFVSTEAARLPAQQAAPSACKKGERSRELMYMHFTRQGGCAALLCTTLERPAAHVRPDLPQGCQRSVITYSSLISACEKAGEWRLALQLLEEMRREGCNPNVISYNSLITACAQGGYPSSLGCLQMWEECTIHGLHCAQGELIGLQTSTSRSTSRRAGLKRMGAAIKALRTSSKRCSSPS